MKFILRRLPLLLVLMLTSFTGCSPTIELSAFSRSVPKLDPIAFWTGRTASWGVMENRDGQPISIVSTRTESSAETADGLHMVQHVKIDSNETVRTWHMFRRGGNTFSATASDMVGVATGHASGRMFHWTWTLATKPGDSLRDVTMDQWMYLADNGTLMNRTIITKLGVRLAEVSEQFVKGN